MKFSKRLGLQLLAIWLILSGFISILQLSFTGLSTMMAALAIAAGTLLLLSR